ncbi:MAG: hypothetical protein KHY77_00460 [Butyricicoccus pullicaecorum]|nr:hypothetical protein [Butyricicoccus pullicaecorum]
MNIFQYIPYVLLFAVATAMIYAWGLWRSQNQSKDLSAMLCAKGVARIRKQLKKHGPMTRKELESAVKDLTACQPFSSKRIGVTDPKQFLDSLLPYMCTQKLIEKQTQGKQILYVYRK